MSLLDLIAQLTRKFQRPALEWVEPEDLHSQVGVGTVPVLLDVRGAEEFNGKLGHIPGAINIPLDAFNPDLDELSSLTNANIVIVCHTDKRSAKAREILCAARFTSVAVLRGGMLRWNEMGFANDDE